MDSINSSGNPDNTSIEIDGTLFLRDLGINHPFGRVCCKTRRNIPTLCDGTCRDCKKKMTEFIQNEPLRSKANDIIRSGGDATYEPIPLEIYRKNLAERIARWQKQKQEVITNTSKQEHDKKSLATKVSNRMCLVEKMSKSPAMPYNLQ